jgi:hypothetical protein
MHLLTNGVGLVRDVLVGIIAIRLDGVITKMVGRWHMRRDRPDFIWVPPSHRGLPGGLGYRFPARPADPFTGQAW